ncbi:hypothetical protein [Motilimonas pumila]|uniref:Uncharacterized protein n=1 Tax=Motilimonas pumila TaxID=2303987 RepID=A0A418YKQ6_9GAMM|nr:hypothetical protein [Motilimonas pumila]RJG51564.1 hypothetical protein D1Z90_02195 [Motilimonas pumila]
MTSNKKLKANPKEIHSIDLIGFVIFTFSALQPAIAEVNSDARAVLNSSGYDLCIAADGSAELCCDLLGNCNPNYY